MTLHADDPRLTAYALGELRDEELAEFERELAESVEAERELAEIRETIRLVRHELAAEAVPAIDGVASSFASSEAPKVAVAVDSTREQRPRRRSRTIFYVAAAAGLLVALSLALLSPAIQSAREGGRETEQVALVPGFLPTSPQGGRQWYYDTNSPVAAPTEPAVSSLQQSLERDQEGVEGNSRREMRLTDSIAPTTPAPLSEVEFQEADKPVSLSANGSLNSSANEGYYRELSRGEGAASKDELGRGVIGLELLPNSPAPVDAFSTTADRSLAEQGAATEMRRVPGQETLGRFAGSMSAQGGRGINYTIAKPVYEAKPYDTDADTLTLGFTPQIVIQEEVERLSELGDQVHNTEAYAPIVENPFQAVLQNPLSTFSIDVDTASYSNVRRFLTSGTLPPPGAVRIEELVNYFRYDYAAPGEADGAPFAAHLEVAECPWRPAHRLVRIGLKGREMAAENRPASNLVFLLDVSGSMDQPNKLPLVKQGMRMLVEGLRENDRVAIVVYAGASGLVLESTSGENKETILSAIDQLTPGGSTNGASGIELAYEVAARHFIKEGTNRVILATDGDFNVGVTDQSQLVRLIEEQAKSGVFLSVLGFGMGNLKDSTLEQLADRGNGNYAYVDTEREARKVLVEQLSGTLVTIAKDVKIQIEFNPARVASYRLIGYENRLLAKEDFNDDTKDAGEIGAGHTVTALYEVVPVEAAEKHAVEGAKSDRVEPSNEDVAADREVDALEYLTVAQPSDAALASPNLLTLKLRYKEPEGTESKLLKFAVEDAGRRIGEATHDFQLAASVAAFGMLLRGSQYAGEANYDAIMEWAQPTLTSDAEGYRRELVDLMRTARELATPAQ